MICEAPTETLFKKISADHTPPATTVIVSCYNYGQLCLEALQSVVDQTEKRLSLIVVDDYSTDDSCTILADWFSQSSNQLRFCDMQLLRHRRNQGLSQTRNTAIVHANTPFVFVLDADNLLYPRALETLRRALEHSGCAMAYSLCEKFGEESGLIGNSIWIPEKFAHGNYIDAMSLIRRDLLVQIGGYREMPRKFGWEDYDLWCSFVDQGFAGCHVPQILCRYRVSSKSMLRAETNPFVLENIQMVRSFMEANHSIKFLF